MNIKFSDEFSIISEYSRGEAARTGSYGIGVDHLVLGLIRHKGCRAVRILSEMGVDTAAMKKFIDSKVFRENPIPFSEADSVKATRAAASVLNMAAFEALKTGSEELDSTHLLLAVSLTTDNAASEFLNSQGITHEAILEASRPVRKGKDSGTVRAKAVRFEEMAGALAEQLGILMDSSGKKTNTLS